MSYGFGRFIYIRVPRTGSTTLLHAIRAEYGDVEQCGPQHISAVEARPLWGEDWDYRHKFGVIRNPWEWLVSVYNAGISSSARSGIKENWPGGRVEPPDAPGIHPGQRMNMAFPEWVRGRKTTPADWLFDGDMPAVDEVRLFEDVIANCRERWSAMPHSPYVDWFDDDLAEYVAGLCWREIEIGGYEFGK